MGGRASIVDAMKLYHTQTSPFVRKVMIAAHELGLASRIETVHLRPSPMSPSAELSEKNPLSKIPALVTDDGDVLYDSRVICEYLETLSSGPRLVPREGAARFRVLRGQALADGILDAGILAFYETSQRPKELHWQDWIGGQIAKVRQGFDALEREAASFGADVDLAQIAAGAAIGWVEFRNVLPEPRAGRPRLFAWYDAFRERPSMKATEPVA